VSDELFREVDEEVRQDQYLQLWKKYGVYVAGVVLAVVVVTVAVVLWRDLQQGKREAQGEALLAAIAASQSQPEQALEQFSKLATEGSAGYRLMSRLREAALLSQRGDASGAVAVYDAVAGDSDQDQIYRDLARLLAVSHGMSIIDRAEVEERLSPLMAVDNTWHYSARELVATAIMASGDTAAARAAFQELVDDSAAPSGIRARAAELLAIMGS